MNLFEKAALKRAHRNLGLPVSVEVLDFDIATNSPGLWILLGDVAIVSPQIDVVCTSTGLFFRAGIQVAFVPWGDVLEFEFVNWLGDTYHFYLRGNRRATVKVKGSARQSFVLSVESTLDNYINSLSTDLSRERSDQLELVRAWRLQMEATYQRVRSEWRKNPSVHVEVFLPDGRVISGEASQLQDGVRIIAKEGPNFIIPYVSLHSFVVRDHEELSADCNLEGVKSLTIRCEDPKVWYDNYQIRSQGWYL